MGVSTGPRRGGSDSQDPFRTLTWSQVDRLYPENRDRRNTESWGDPNSLLNGDTTGSTPISVGQPTGRKEHTENSLRTLFSGPTFNRDLTPEDGFGEGHRSRYDFRPTPQCTREGRCKSEFL